MRRGPVAKRKKKDEVGLGRGAEQRCAKVTSIPTDSNSPYPPSWISWEAFGTTYYQLLTNLVGCARIGS